MNFKSIVLLIVFELIILNTFSQNTLSGYVKDENTKEELVGVSIYISNLKTGTFTDNRGNYHLTNIKTGNYLISISYIGYKTIIKQININKDSTLNLFLIPSVKELNEIIVTSVARSTELKLSPIIVTTINRNAINQNIATNLIDGLKNIPGISQITSGAAISKPIIRGLGYNRVITLNNGIKQEGQQWGDEHGIEIDEYAVDRVEIVKGPGSLIYGSDGIAGVLNFLTNNSMPIGNIKTQFISNYQSNNNLIANSFSNKGNKNGFQWQARFSNKVAGNYQNAYDGKVLNSGFKETDGSLFLGINKKWGYSHIAVSSYNNTLNLIEGERDSLGRFVFMNSNGIITTAINKNFKGYAVGFPHQQINHLNSSINNYFILKKGTLNFDLGFQNNKRKEFGDPTRPNNINLFFDLYTFNYNLRYNLPKYKNWETTFGIGGMQQLNKNKGLEFLIPEYKVFDIGTFILTQKTFNKFVIAGGLRFDNRNMSSKKLILDSMQKPSQVITINSIQKFNSFVNNYNGFSGSLGVSYLITNTSTIKLNFSRGFRAPSVVELTSNGKHEGSFKYEIGNSNLKSEFSHQVDLAYFYDSEHITFELTPFINYITNYIYIKKLNGVTSYDSIVDLTDPVPAFKYTSGNAMLYGGEIYFDLHPHPQDWLHIENSFSFVQGSQINQTDSTKYLPFIPAPKYRSEIKAELKKPIKSISNAFIKFGVNYYFKQNKIYNAFGTETLTPAYTLLNAGIGATFNAFNRNDFFSIFINGDNLADVAYQNHLSKLKYLPVNQQTGRVGVYNMGRNFSVKLLLNI